MSYLRYLKRIFSAYLTGKTSQLTFWHGRPLENANFELGELSEYYMPFIAKANYQGHFDAHGIPMLDYHGTVGLQYNPIAVAQYGLGNYNLWCRTGEDSRKSNFIRVAQWLVKNLEETPFGTKVWYHHFDWEYRDKLKAPWHSSLAQGQGLSLLVRAHKETGDEVYLDVSRQVIETFFLDVNAGGVTYTDSKGYKWFEEAIVDPPTHILNGFIWAAWGVYDFYLSTSENAAKNLFDEAVRTLTDNLNRYDTGFWSLYEQSGTRMKMVASPFYHSLHIVQLRVMHKLTKDAFFKELADRWDAYRQNTFKRTIALIYKSIFKILYY